jgi:hypothetical protein
MVDLLRAVASIYSTTTALSESCEAVYTSLARTVIRSMAGQARGEVHQGVSVALSRPRLSCYK